VAFPTVTWEGDQHLFLGGCLGVMFNMQLTITYFALELNMLREALHPLILGGQIGGDDFMLFLISRPSEAKTALSIIKDDLVNYLGRIKGLKKYTIGESPSSILDCLFCKKRVRLVVSKSAKKGSMRAEVSSIPHLPLELKNLLPEETTSVGLNEAFNRMLTNFYALDRDGLGEFKEVYTQTFLNVHELGERLPIATSKVSRMIPLLSLSHVPSSHIVYTREAMDVLPRLPVFTLPDGGVVLQTRKEKLRYALNARRLVRLKNIAVMDYDGKIISGGVVTTPRHAPLYHNTLRERWEQEKLASPHLNYVEIMTRHLVALRKVKESREKEQA